MFINGAEDEVYMAQSPGYLSGNQPLQDVSELRLLAGMDATLYQRLLPYVCALADETLQVNVNTLQPAQAALLSALFPAELTLAEARQLLQARARPPAGAASPLSCRSRYYKKPIPPPRVRG